MFLNQFFSNPVVSLTKPTTLFGSIADRRKSKLLKIMKDMLAISELFFFLAPERLKEDNQLNRPVP